MAALMNRTQILIHLLEKGYPSKKRPNARYNYYYSPLAWACRHGNFKMVEALIAHKVEINESHPFGGMSRPPIIYAIKRGHTNIVSLLIAHGAVPSTRSVKAAVLKSRFELAAILVATGMPLH